MSIFKFIKNYNTDWVPSLAFIFAAIIWRTDYYVLSLYVAIPIMVLWTFRLYKTSAFKNKYCKLYLWLIVCMCCTSMLNNNGGDINHILTTTIATFLISISVYILSLHKENRVLLSIGFIALFVAIMYASLSSGLVSSFDYANEFEREQGMKLNSNQYAYFSLFAIMATRIILGERNRINPIFLLAIYFLLIAIACYTALLTASRQVLLLEIPLVAFYIYTDFLKSKQRGRKALVILFIVLLVIVGLPYFLSYYDNSYLAERASREVEDDARSYLLKEAIGIGLGSPFLGVGLDANVSFSHCTYTHLFSRCGMFSFFVFVYMVLYPIMVQYRRYRETQNSYFLILFFCVFLFAFGNLFYVYTDQPYMMPILFLLLGESDRIYEKYSI